MSTEPPAAALHCDVRRRYPVALIVVTGDLRLGTAHLLRAAVLKVLVDRPVGVVLDLLAVEVLDPAAATVLPLIEQHAAYRAEAALLLAAPSPSVRRELRRLGVGLAVHDTRADAVTAAAAHAVPSRVRMVFGPELDAPGRAREVVRRACEQWQLDVALRTRTVRVVNELVTNAVIHAGTDGTLLLTRRRHHLHVAVRDEDPVTTFAAGLGLSVVDALAGRWGVRVAPDGKVVWATLRIWPELSDRSGGTR